MALEFTEYLHARRELAAQAQMVDGRELATQSVAIGGVSTPSAAFTDKTRAIVLSKIDVDCRIAIGKNPVAVSAGVGQTRFLKAGAEYAFDVQPGDKLAVITA